MPQRVVSLAACVMLCGSAYAEDGATSTSVAHQHGQHTRGNQKPRGPAANKDYARIHSQSKNDVRYPDFSISESADPTDLLAIQKLSGAGNATVGAGPGSGRTAFLLQGEHDAAIKLLTTNIVLRVKLSSDGVHLHLAF